MIVHIYSKRHQMLKEKYDLRQDELDKAENLARFEVQMHRSKIYELIQQGKLPYKFEGSLSSYFIALGCSAPQILVDAASKIFGVYPYYSLESMQARIINSTLKTKTKDKMMDFLHFVAILHDADKAFNEMGKHPDNKKLRIKNLIKNFESLNMNIVPIMLKDKDKNINVPIFPSIVDLVLKSIYSDLEYYQKLFELNMEFNPSLYISSFLDKDDNQQES